eukprot:7130463-Prymnesium_polylepis.1
MHLRHLSAELRAASPSCISELHLRAASLRDASLRCISEMHLSAELGAASLRDASQRYGSGVVF